MKSTTALAWGLAAASMALTIAHRALLTVEPQAIDPLSVGGRLGVNPWFTIVLTLFFGLWPFAVVGALVAARQPRNPIGWLFCAIALSEQTRGLASTYARGALVANPGEWPGGVEAIALARLAAYLPFTLALFALLLFPTGRVPSTRWKPLLFLFGAYTATILAIRAFGTWPALYGVANPVGVGGALGAGLDALFGILFPGVWCALALTVALSLFFRWRAANGIERQQLKWFAYAIGIALAGVSAFWLPGGWDWFASQPTWLYVAAVVGYSGSVAAIPIGAGIAIFRYRLYDIDVLINRTLVYGATVVTLGALYIAAIVGLQGVLRPFTQGNELAVALSTLTAVALFDPVRSHVQRGVDRRFYRSRYDATRTLDSLALRLRDQVDLDALGSELLTAVREAIQPAHASLWLRDRTR